MTGHEHSTRHVERSRPTVDELANFSVTIANQVGTLSLDNPETTVNILDLSLEEREELVLRLEETIRHQLEEGNIVAISNETFGTVIGLAKHDQTLDVSITQRYQFDEDRELHGPIPSGDIRCSFDEKGRCAIEIHDQSGEAPITIISPLKKRQGQNRFSITTGSVEQAVLIEEHGHLRSMELVSRHVANIRPILIENLVDNLHPWAPENRDLQAGSWLINFF